MKHTWETMQLDVKGNRMLVKHTRDLESYLEKDNVPKKGEIDEKRFHVFFSYVPNVPLMANDVNYESDRLCSTTVSILNPSWYVS